MPGMCKMVLGAVARKTGICALDFNGNSIRRVLIVVI